MLHSSFCFFIINVHVYDYGNWPLWNSLKPVLWGQGVKIFCLFFSWTLVVFHFAPTQNVFSLHPSPPFYSLTSHPPLPCLWLPILPETPPPCLLLLLFYKPVTSCKNLTKPVFAFCRKTKLLEHNLKRTCRQDYSSSGHHSLLNDQYLEKEPFVKLSKLRQHHVERTSQCRKSWTQLWKGRLHFVSLPTYDFGNWIPYALMHWPCFGSGCALAQVVIKSKEGKLQNFMCWYFYYNG